MSGSAFQWLPRQGSPMGYGTTSKGEKVAIYPDPTFWRFLWTVAEKLGGVEAPSLLAVSAATQSNAQSLQDTVTVLKDAALPGADVIPPPVGNDGNPIP